MMDQQMFPAKISDINTIIHNMIYQLEGDAKLLKTINNTFTWDANKMNCKWDDGPDK